MLHPVTSPPALEPIRALAFYLASYIDTWPALIAQHQQALAELPSSSDAATVLRFIAPRLLSHLEHSERDAVSKQSLLLRTLAQHGLESLRAQTVVGQHFGQQILDKLSTAQPATQTLIEAYYRLHLRGDALMARVGLSDKEIAPALCRARTELDWLNKADVWQAADGEYLFPSLMSDYFSGLIDKDSEKLLGDTISKDLSRLVGFERQWRIHLLLSAAFVSLPFPPSRSDSQASNAKQKGITIGENHPRSGPRMSTGSSTVKSGRQSLGENSARSQSYAPVYIAGGCLVLAGILAIMLMSNSVPVKPLTDIPERMSPSTTISQSTRTSEKITLENKPAKLTPQTPMTVTAAPKTVPVIAGPSASNQFVNIMALIDTARDAVSGTWIKSDSILTAKGSNRFNLLQFPYLPPSEYDLKITFSRLDGNNDLVGIIVNKGVQCAAIIGAYEDTIAGFSMVGGRLVKDNVTHVDSPKIITGKRYVLIISVREEKMELLLDDKLLTTWVPAQGTLSIFSSWALPNPSAIGMGFLKGKYEFYDITIREISGVGSHVPTVPSIAQPSSPITNPPLIVPEINTQQQIKSTSNRLDYLTIRDRSFSELINGKNNVARKILNDAIANPAYAAFTNELQLDLSCVTLADGNHAAVTVGAKSLIDIREFTLEELSGAKILLGRSHDHQIKAVSDNGLTLESKIGNGYLHREIPFTQLSPATRAELAREALKNKPDAELHALVGSILQQKPDTKSSSMILLRAWVKKASGKDGQAALAAHLNTQLDELELVSVFDQRLKELELQVSNKDPETVIKPLADLTKEMTESTNNPQLWQRHKNVTDLINKRQGEINAEKEAKKAAELARLAQAAIAQGIIYEWDFSKGDIGPWTAQKGASNLNVVNGALVGEVAGSPSFIIASNLKIPVTEAGYIEIRLRGAKAGVTDIYFTTTKRTEMTWAAKLPYHGNEFVTLRFDITNVIGFNQDLTQLRIDPLNGSDTKAKFEIQSIKILRE